MKKTVLYLLGGLLVLYLFGAFFSITNAEAKEIVLKGATAWPPNDSMSTGPFFLFQNMANKRLKGKLRIEYVGGPEIIPSRQLIEALRTGIVDVALLSVAYYQRAAPEVAVLNLSELNHRALRENGFYEAFNEIHRKKLNTFYYAWANGEGLRTVTYLTKKIEKPNFSGLKIRSSASYIPLLKALGAAPVVLPPPEIYTALERGVIDGMCWPNMGITDWSWHEVIKFMIDHEFHRGGAVVLFNLDTWKGLDESLQKALLEMSTILEDESAKLCMKLRSQYRKLYQASGVEFITFSTEDTKKYQDTIREASNKDFLARNPESGPSLLNLVTR